MANFKIISIKHNLPFQVNELLNSFSSRLVRGISTQNPAFDYFFDILNSKFPKNLNTIFSHPTQVSPSDSIESYHLLSKILEIGQLSFQNRMGPINQFIAHYNCHKNVQGFQISPEKSGIKNSSPNIESLHNFQVWNNRRLKLFDSPQASLRIDMLDQTGLLNGTTCLGLNIRICYSNQNSETHILNAYLGGRKNIVCYDSFDPTLQTLIRETRVPDKDDPYQNNVDINTYTFDSISTPFCNGWHFFNSLSSQLLTATIERGRNIFKPSCWTDPVRLFINISKSTSTLRMELLEESDISKEYRVAQLHYDTPLSSDLVGILGFAKTPHNNWLPIYYLGMDRNQSPNLSSFKFSSLSGPLTLDGISGHLVFT
ncbi:hypothetical protein DID75_04945 [Candidatus Marinamargulisbacteria bacterium SCGC AG-410-N11]|nr:hypothetical protein DID75_04945 [Candidatus Marinamargulisbacteria bacterium SCGC AG-410-N11]